MEAVSAPSELVSMSTAEEWGLVRGLKLHGVGLILLEGGHALFRR